MTKRGRYIVIEGLDGSGKTTQFEKLVNYFGSQAVGVREPGGTPMGEAIRTLLKDGAIDRSANTNMFLFSAARANLIDAVVRPAIAAGKTVVSDRSWLTTATYQAAEGANTKQLEAISTVAVGEFLVPDLLIFIDVDPAICYQRLVHRGNHATDYFESKGEVFFRRTRELYIGIIRNWPNAHIVLGDAPRDAVWQSIKRVLEAQSS